MATPAPLLVRASDGRLDPFEPDRLSRALFAATEGLGRPDAFLARELADHITRCLGDEADGPLTTAELAEQVAKYVRELGHPALALAYRRVSAEPRPADVFPRDVVSVVNDGLLLLTGTDRPLHLAGVVAGPGLDPTRPGLGLSTAVASAASCAGGWLALDGPDHALAAQAGEPEQLAAAFCSELRHTLDAADRRAVLNLNIAAPPAWASDPGTGPLFAGLGAAADAGRIARLAEAVGRRAAGDPRVAVNWHLTPPGLNADLPPVVADLVARSLRGAAIEFVIDRARQPVTLGPGVTRQNPAALLVVGVHLPRLAEQVAPATEERFLAKLGSLARLARSAGHAKLDFLRRHGRPEVRDAFLLDRARLVVVPVGLDEAVRHLAGSPLCDPARGTALARRVVEGLQEALASAPPHNMSATLDGLPFGFRFADETPARRDAAGLTPWDADAPPRLQLRCAGALHGVARAGTAAILVPPDVVRSLRDRNSGHGVTGPHRANSGHGVTGPQDAGSPADDLLGTLRLAAHYDVQRVRFVRVGEPAAAGT